MTTPKPKVREGRPRTAKPGDIYPELYDPAWLGDPGQECPCCGHPAMSHDIETLDDPRPSCCSTTRPYASAVAAVCPCGPALTL